MKQNQVLLVGYVGQDIKSYRFNESTRLATIRVATHHTQKKDGDKLTVTIWHHIVAWNQLATFAECNFVKGSRILVEGAIAYRTVKSKAGVTRQYANVRAISLLNLDR